MNRWEIFFRYIAGGIGGFALAVVFISFIRESNSSSVLLSSNENILPYLIALTVACVTGGILFVYGHILKSRIDNTEKSLTLKNEFVSTVIHEIRTPLTYILWSLEMFMKEAAPNLKIDHKNLVSKTYDSLRELVSITENFFDAAKLDLGRMSVSIKQITLCEVEKRLNGMLNDFTQATLRKEVSFSRAILFDPSATISIDWDKIRQVISNLLENALRYTPSGRTISLFARYENGWVAIKISDTGIGIPPTEQKNIFKKFYRASNARKVVSVGTGVGLYVSQQFVLAHHGTIELSSEENKGTAFTIRLPTIPKDNVTDFFIKI